MSHTPIKGAAPTVALSLEELVERIHLARQIRDNIPGGYCSATDTVEPPLRLTLLHLAFIIFGKKSSFEWLRGDPYTPNTTWLFESLEPLLKLCELSTN